MTLANCMGFTARDKVTGFTGTVFGYIHYMTGCDQILIIPPVNSEGKRVEGEWFDIQRVEAVPEGDPAYRKPITMDNGNTPGPDKPGPTK